MQKICAAALVQLAVFVFVIVIDKMTNATLRPSIEFVPFMSMIVIGALFAFTKGQRFAGFVGSVGATALMFASILLAYSSL
jgi:hypothetical protein